MGHRAGVAALLVSSSGPDAESRAALRLLMRRLPGVSVVPGIRSTHTLTAFRAYSKKDLEQAWDIGLE